MAALVFSIPRRLDRAEIDALPAIARGQLERAAAGSFRDMTFEESLASIERDNGFWEHLRGTRGDTAVYDLWLMAGDCGRLFHADQLRLTGIVMVQSTFNAPPRSAHLLDEINAAYAEALRARPPER